MGVLVVYGPGIEACVGLVDWEAISELCELPVYWFECYWVGPFKQSRWIHYSVFFVMLFWQHLWLAPTFVRKKIVFTHKSVAHLSPLVSAKTLSLLRKHFANLSFRITWPVKYCIYIKKEEGMLSQQHT